MRSPIGAVLAALFLTGGTSSTVSCSPCSVNGQDPIEYTDGHTNVSRTVYQTSLPSEEMLHFPQGREYDLVHGLGSVPVSVDLYLSFRETLTSSGDKDDDTEPNNVAPTAGNQAVIEVWTDKFIRVRNDTCAEFYLRAVITADPDEVPTDGDGGAGGAGGATAE